MDFLHNPLDIHTGAVDVLIDAGYGSLVPRPWGQLRQRFTDQLDTALGAPMARYINALVTGEPKDLTGLYADALASASADAPEVARVINATRMPTLARLEEILNPALPKLLAATANDFDSHAKQFTDALAVVGDPHIGADQLLHEDESVRSAWLTCAVEARSLEAAQAPYFAVCRLMGHPVDADAESTLAATIDPGSAKRRELFAAYEDTAGRCGRWAPVATTPGASIRALRDPASLVPYRRPEPLKEEWHLVGRAQYERRLVDPEEQLEATR